MNTRHLKYFRYAYETRSYTQAAYLASMSPQGLARAVHGLEEKIGAPLFSAGRGADDRVPTPYADALYRYALMTDAADKSLEQEIKRIRLSESGTIRLAMVMGTFAGLGADFVKNYEKTHPGIRIITEEVGDYFCDNALLNGDCDLAITREPFHGEFETTTILNLSLGFWVHRGSFLAKKKELKIEDLHNRNICIFDRSLKSYRTIIHACREKKVLPRSITESVELFYIYDWVLRGGEIGVTTNLAAKLPVFNLSDDIVAVPSEGISSAFGLSRMKSRPLPSHIEDFYEYCLDTLTKRRKGEEGDAQSLASKRAEKPRTKTQLA